MVTRVRLFRKTPAHLARQGISGVEVRPRIWKRLRDPLGSDSGLPGAKLDVRDLGGHLDTTFRGWSSTLAARVRLILAGLLVVFALPLHFMVGWLFFGICLFLVLCMVLRLHFWLNLVFVSYGLLFARCLGLVGSLWLMWVLCSVC